MEIGGQIWMFAENWCRSEVSRMLFDHPAEFMKKKNSISLVDFILQDQYVKYHSLIYECCYQARFSFMQIFWSI